MNELFSPAIGSHKMLNLFMTRIKFLVNGIKVANKSSNLCCHP